MNKEQFQLDRALYAAIDASDYRQIENLLKNGADPTAFYDVDAYRDSMPTGVTTLSYLQSLSLLREVEMPIAKLLLQYGAYRMTSDEFAGEGYSPLVPAVYHENMELIQLLLDLGSSVEESDCDEMLSISEIIEEEGLFGGEVPYILEEGTPTYKKINDFSYLVYARDDEDEIFVLGDLKTSKEKTYLYHGVELALLFYWMVQEGHVSPAMHKALKPFLTNETLSSKANIMSLMNNAIGSQFTIEFIEDDEDYDIEDYSEIKSFAIDYLSPTHWKYNLYDDLALLYPSQIGFASIPNKEKEHLNILKLFSMRCEQYRYESVAHLNSNQNKAELQALIEGREPPKREVDLSALLGNDKKDTLPEDFMK